MKKTKKLESRSYSERILFLIVFIVFVIYSISLLYPVFWLIVNSLKHWVDYSLDMSIGNPFAMPKSLQWSNYKDAFQSINANGVNFVGMLWNSVWITFASTMLGLLVTALFAYCLSKFPCKASTILYAFVIFEMTIHVGGSAGATMKFYVDTGIYDTPLLIVLQSMGGRGMHCLMFYGAFKNLPNDYAEAVYMDGGGEFTVYWKIMFPFVRPIFISLFIINAMTCWNEYLSIVLFMPSWLNLAAGMYLVRSPLIREGKSPVYFAATVFSILPMFMVYVSFNDMIMKNMTVGGLKG